MDFKDFSETLDIFSMIHLFMFFLFFPGSWFVRLGKAKRNGEGDEKIGNGLVI